MVTRTGQLGQGSPFNLVITEVTLIVSCGCFLKNIVRKVLRIMGNKIMLEVKGGNCYIVRGTLAQVKFLLEEKSSKTLFRVPQEEFVNELLYEDWSEDIPKEDIVIWVPKNLKELKRYNSIPKEKIGIIILGNSLGETLGESLKIFKNPKSKVTALDLEQYDWREHAKFKSHLKRLSLKELNRLRTYLAYPGDFLYKIEWEELDVESLCEEKEYVSEARRLLRSVLENTWPEVWNVSNSEATKLVGLEPLENSTLYRGLTSNNRSDLRGLCPNLWLEFLLFRKSMRPYDLNNKHKVLLFGAWVKLATNLYASHIDKGLTEFHYKGRGYEYVGYEFRASPQARSSLRRSNFSNFHRYVLRGNNNNGSITK